MEYVKPALLWILDHPIVWPVIVIGGMAVHASSLRFYRFLQLVPEGIPLPSVAPPLSDSRQVRTVHNVQFVGFQRIQIAPDLPGLAFAALCFENVLIPGEQIADFHFARLFINYRDFNTEEVIAEAFLARWHDGPDAPVDICAGRKQCAIIASSIGSKWGTDSLVDAPINPALEYGFGGSEYKHQSVPLPLGRIKVKATLIGTHNLSIPPVEGVLTLGEDGSASFAQEAYHL